MAKKTTSKKSFEKTVKGWRIGDYIRQLSIVVIGIFITFQGSAWIAQKSQRREAAYILSMVKDELVKNRHNVENQLELLEFEFAGAKAMKPHIHHPESIHPDSLNKYVSIITRVRNYGFVANSFEVLKNSSQFQTIKNKDLLRDLFSVYEELNNFSSGIDSYNAMKSDGMENYFSSLDSGAYDAMHDETDGVFLIFSGIMDNAAMRNYIVTTAYGNNVDYLIPYSRELIEWITAIIDRIDDVTEGKRGRR